MGESPEALFADGEVLADTVTSYYTDYEPESTFIAECGGEVAGYLTGCLDSSRYYKIRATRILPAAFIKSVWRLAIFKPKILKFLGESAPGFLKGEYKAPCLKEYPAHLHINIAEGYRGKGIGSKLMEAYLGYLRSKNVKGVHLTTAAGEACRFFKKNGFRVVSSRTPAPLQNLLKRNLTVYILARKV